MDRREYLKPSRFGDVDKRRLLDKKNLKERRSVRRTTNFNLQRDIGDIAQEVNKKINENRPPKSDVKVTDRKLALQKFRAEREAKKKAIQEKKKPPFVVGIPHHGASPVLRNLNLGNTNKKGTKPTSAQHEFTFQAYKLPQSEKKLTSPQTPTVLKRSVQKKTLKIVPNLVNKINKSPRSLNEEEEEEQLAAPLAAETADGGLHASVGGTLAPVVKNETLGSVSPPVVEASEVEKEDAGEISIKNEDNELANQAAFQYTRLQSETTRLMELADKWKTLTLRESPPQEVVDEVDSMVGQTRLLTSDKFQQFRRLVVQYEQQTGTHPVTLDDLNGFWDMVYLQVESLDRKYAALDALRSSNWVKPSRKKRRRVKTLNVEKVTETGISPTSEKQKTPLNPPGDQHSPSNEKPIVNNLLLSKKRTRSNSPSPYIAMRLSGIGRTSNIMGQSSAAGETPKSKLVLAEAFREQSGINTPKSILSTPSVEKDIAAADEQLLIPAITPRRSMRLMTKLTTPSSCSACESASCHKSRCLNRRSPGGSQRRSPRQAKTPAKEPQETRPSTELTQLKEADMNKPSTSGVKFSLRPSILLVNEDTSEKPKRASKRRQPSVNTAGAAPVEQDAETLGQKSRRSTRQSRKVTFVSGVEEKPCFKHPATPYRKLQTDS